MTTKFNKKRLFASALLCSLVSAPAFAANWLMLQGTEADGTAPRAKVWGFIQTQYQKNTSDPNAGDEYVPPKLIGPNLTSQSQFNVNRARIGVRGTGFPLDDKVNYFILAEFGNNAITAPGGGGAYVTDASITLNQIPGARIRMGLFKTPGAEEGLQAIHVFDYINFTTVSNQLLLERFPNQSYTANRASSTSALPVTTPLTTFNKPVGAFRDVGVQVFDTFAVGGWEHTYAVMLGNGNGLNWGDNNNSKDLYLYWSSEKVGPGKGPFRQGLKMFAWSQTGKRLLDNDGTGAKEYDRDRSGLGVKWLAKPFRITAEYMQGKGMIFQGPDKTSFYLNPAVAGTPNDAVGNGAKGKANGYYLEGGYYIPSTNWEIDARYDVYNRLSGDKKGVAGPLAGKGMEVDFKNITLGTQYHFNKKTHIAVNVTKMKAEAVDFPTGAGPNANLEGLDKVYAVQLTHIF